MKITNFHNLPDPLYRTICYAIEKYEGPRAAELIATRRISVTTLVNPPRLTLLRAVHEPAMEVDAADLLYMVGGIAFHYMMSQVGWSESEEPLIEERIERVHKGWIITGQFDVFAKSILADWKHTSVWSILTPKFEWDAQLNIYRWLMKTRGLDAKGLETWAMLRDWSHAKRAKDRRIPEIPFARVERPVWDEEVVESYIEARLALYDEAVRIVTSTANPNNVLVCHPEERWERKGEAVRCKSYCDVAEFCSFGQKFHLK